MIGVAVPDEEGVLIICEINERNDGGEILAADEPCREAESVACDPEVNGGSILKLAILLGVGETGVWAPFVDDWLAALENEDRVRGEAP